MALPNRIKRLETTRRVLDRHCPECGFDADGHARGPVQFSCRPPRVLDFTNPPPSEDTSKDLCGRCGSRVVLRFRAPRVVGGCAGV